MLNNYPNLELHAASVHDLVFDHTNTSGPSRWGSVAGLRLGWFECIYLILFTYSSFRYW